jgi:hypothetical protein
VEIRLGVLIGGGLAGKPQCDCGARTRAPLEYSFPIHPHVGSGGKRPGVPANVGSLAHHGPVLSDDPGKGEHLWPGSRDVIAALFRLAKPPAA